MPRVTTNNGYSLGYEETGGGHARSIVFLHGVGSDKSVWHPQLHHFGKTHRAVAFDYPGYGDSDPAPQGTTRDQYAADILAAICELGISPSHICGLSLGGVVAIALHTIASNCCASLILADTFARHPDGQGIYGRSVAASANMRAMAEARVDVLLAQPADPAVRNEVVETMARIDPAAFRIGAEAVWLADQGGVAADIAMPTLVLCGTEDRVTPPSLSHELAAMIPGARYEEIEHAGHLTNLEQPAEFNRLLEQFIIEVESGS